MVGFADGRQSAGWAKEQVRPEGELSDTHLVLLDLVKRLEDVENAGLDVGLGEAGVGGIRSSGVEPGGEEGRRREGGRSGRAGEDAGEGRSAGEGGCAGEGGSNGQTGGGEGNSGEHVGLERKIGGWVEGRGSWLRSGRSASRVERRSAKPTRGHKTTLGPCTFLRALDSFASTREEIRIIRSFMR